MTEYDEGWKRQIYRKMKAESYGSGRRRGKTTTGEYM